MRNWIKPKNHWTDSCPTYRKRFVVRKEALKKAKVAVTALGVYQIQLNGEKITDAVLMPGWTSYQKRLQVQTYDITNQLSDENCLEITVGKGWYRSPIPSWLSEEERTRRNELPPALYCLISLEDVSGQKTEMEVDLTWEVRKSL